MKKVFIKYNPYKLETDITVDGKGLAQNSRIGEAIAPGSRLQEWVEDLPGFLVDEYNDTAFDILFHGTLLDYEDLTEVFSQAYDNGTVTEVNLERKPAKETSDKETLIDDVFQEIQNGPFDELRDEDILSAFEQAKSSDFEVCVVATMSAGKSTLINAMLGNKLMPSKLEACTAIITRIKDSLDGMDHWEAEVYDKKGCHIESHSNLTLETMERLNSNEQVSEIRVNGDIPFVSSEDVSLVLVDTPGPNNSRDPNHKKVQSDFLSKSSKSLVLYIMTGEFGSDDDNLLLQRVSESMSVGGKQSKDRFIFVVNKIDDRRKEDGDTEQTLNKIRAYLRSHGIERPNIFPAAALPALNIRLIQNGVPVDEDTEDETFLKVKKLNRNESLHCEAYAPLPASIRGQINDQLALAANDETGRSEALIHTGVVSIEAAIRQYVLKYAKTAKIKNIVDTFIHKLDEVGCFEKTKNELAKNRDENEKIVHQIERMEQKVNDTKSAKAFKDNVDEAVLGVNNDSTLIIEQIIKRYQERLSQRLDSLRGCEISVDDAEEEAESLKRFALRLEPDFREELESLINKNLTNTCNALIQEYRERLASLADEEGVGGFSSIKINPFQLMSGSHFSIDGISINNLVQDKEVEDGREWVENTSKKWYKPWTWFQESGYYRTKYKTVKYVKADELAQEFLAPITDGLWACGDEAKKFALKQSKNIADSFTKEFRRLDDELKKKLNQLKSYATDKEQAEARIAETERRLKWLEEIKAKVESILEI
jgi:predicted GTPase/BMFP domain-containing protein YqiC